MTPANQQWNHQTRETSRSRSLVENLIDVDVQHDLAVAESAELLERCTDARDIDLLRAARRFDMAEWVIAATSADRAVDRIDEITGLLARHHLRRCFLTLTPNVFGLEPPAFCVVGH